jgi:hypothetical protein
MITEPSPPSSNCKAVYMCNQCLGEVYEYADLVMDSSQLRCEICQEAD